MNVQLAENAEDGSPEDTVQKRLSAHSPLLERPTVLITYKSTKSHPKAQ